MSREATSDASPAGPRKADLRRVSWPIRLAVGSGSIIIGLALGAMVVASGRPAGPSPVVALEPARIDHTGRRFRDGEMLRAEFTLKNASKSPVTVRHLLASCSCSTALPRDHRQPPFDLAPGEEVVCTLVTSLKSRLGRQSFELTVETEAAGTPLPPVTGRVELVVDAGLTPFPASLDAGSADPGQAITGRIVLGDTLPEGDVTVSGVTVSNPDLMEATCRADDSIVQRSADFTIRGRYAVDLLLRPDGATPTHREFVDVALSDGTEIRVPVVFGANVEYEVTPARVVFDGVRPDDRVERTILVRLRRPDANDLRVVDLPSCLRADVEPFGQSQYRVRISGVAPDGPDATGLMLRQSDGTSAAPFSVPIVFRVD
jgi:hypothetical protein